MTKQDSEFLALAFFIHGLNKAINSKKDYNEIQFLHVGHLNE